MILKTVNLTKKYGKFAAVDNLNIEIENNTVFGLIGPNGAGKSTTLGMLSTLIRPTSGDALIDGISLINEPDKVKNIIGFLPHETLFYINQTPLKNMIFYSRLSGYTINEAYVKSKELLALVGLNGKEDIKVNELSNGQKKLLGIAQALIHSPKLLILDEPFSALDTQTRVILRDLILKIKSNTSVIISEHILFEIERICDKIAIINNGKKYIESSMGNIKENKNQISIEFSEINENIIKKIKKLKGVKNSEIKDKVLKLIFSGNKDNLNVVMDFLVKNNLSPISVKQGHSVEEFFIENTQ